MYSIYKYITTFPEICCESFNMVSNSGRCSSSLNLVKAIYISRKPSKLYPFICIDIYTYIKIHINYVTLE